jgi:hypothetical protein
MAIPPDRKKQPSSTAIPGESGQADILRRILTETRFGDAARQALQAQIYDEILSTSKNMDSPNFTAFHPDDLQSMVYAYDHHFLSGACSAALEGRLLKFRLAPRLTKAGGLTKWTKRRDRRTGVVLEDFEISVSSHLLFQTFKGEQREVKVVGLPCTNRLEAMQRIVEHELVHLCETLAWRGSSCKGERFQSIATRLFGHLEHTHRLVTTAEVARTRHGIQPGSRVMFEMDGHWLHGIVNRVTKRVTVLVPDTNGRQYSDGHRYTRFYVPLSMLRPADRK